MGDTIFMSKELDLDEVFRLSGDLDKLDEYIPLILHRFLSDEYFDNVSEDAMQEYYKSRTILQTVENPSEYLEDELLNWLQEHKEFQSIIKE